MRVALVTTGKTELQGLPKALSRLFQGVTFVGVEDVPGRAFRSFTSHRLPPPPADVPRVVDRLVSVAASMVDPAVENCFDLVIILDDLELANRDQPGVVVDVVRRAALRHLDRYASDPPRRAALSVALRSKVSFHLVRPMIEAWFFGAPAALTLAGVPSIAYHVRPGDHEDFLSTDVSYIAAVSAACPRWLRYEDRGDRPKWIGAGAARVLHPKGYLQWLMIDGLHPCCTTYAEVEGGAVALSGIDWTTLLSHPNRAGFARALVNDLSHALGEGLPVASAGFEAPETSIQTPRAPHVLRNI